MNLAIELLKRSLEHLSYAMTVSSTTFSDYIEYRDILSAIYRD